MSTEWEDNVNTQVLDTDATQPLSTEPSGDGTQSQTQPQPERGADTHTDSQSDGLFNTTPNTAPTSSTPRVWNAQTLSDEEPPARGVRLGQLAWGLIVVLSGLFLIALAFVPANSFPLLLIGLVAVLGLTLIVIALVTSLKHPGRTRFN